MALRMRRTPDRCDEQGRSGEGQWTTLCITQDLIQAM